MFNFFFSVVYNYIVFFNENILYSGRMNRLDIHVEISEGSFCACDDVPVILDTRPVPLKSVKDNLKEKVQHKYAFARAESVYRHHLLLSNSLNSQIKNSQCISV